MSHFKSDASQAYVVSSCGSKRVLKKEWRETYGSALWGTERSLFLPV